MTHSVSGVAADVRALGMTAPIRAVYELSKRAGGHGLIFRPSPNVSVPLPSAVLPSQPALSRSAASRAAGDARRILEGAVPIFGRDLALPNTCGWHQCADTRASWTSAPWWRVDIRSGSRSGDVKWTWELGRHRHLLVLARAAHLDDNPRQELTTLVSQLRSWLAANPLEVGVHWYSNLEIALRGLVWLQVLDLVADRIPADLRVDMARHLLHSGRHLYRDLPYTVSSMRNNHMLGDALGLMALGKAFDRPRWWRIGHRLFEGQLARHMRVDGSMIEDSLSYHRFVTEMLVVRVLLGDAPDTVTCALRTSGEHLARLGVFGGPVPQYGDWDEGRVLGSSGDPLDTSGSAALALALSGTGAPAAWREAYDECAWYAPEGEPVPVPAAVADGRPIGGGFARGVQGGWTAWLKAGGGTSHQHADLCSTVFTVDGQWVVGDPGTGTYNGPLEQRNAFRTSGAHSVLRRQGADQLVPHRAFRWLHAASGVVGPPPVVAGHVVMWGVHDAYRRLPGGGRTVRIVVLRDGALTVADVREGGQGEDWALTLPLHPDVQERDGRVLLPDGSSLDFLLPAEPVRVHGCDTPYAGWWSHTYGSAVPATWLQMSGAGGGAVVWGVHRPETAPAERLSDGLRANDAELRIAFSPTTANLTVHRDGREEQVLYARLPG